jgi:branched-chain amino acid aminotransferase
MTVFASRNTPTIKSTNYRTCLGAWEKAQGAGCFEAILTDEMGEVFEGSRSNVFWIKSGELFTRQYDILPGITRQIILSKFSCPVNFGNLNVTDFKLIDELFITNSGSGIVPISHVNGSIIGNGAVGEITRNLLNDYTKWIEENIESVRFEI